MEYSCNISDDNMLFSEEDSTAESVECEVEDVTVNPNWSEQPANFRIIQTITVQFWAMNMFIETIQLNFQEIDIITYVVTKTVTQVNNYKTIINGTVRNILPKSSTVPAAISNAQRRQSEHKY